MKMKKNMEVDEYKITCSNANKNEVRVGFFFKQETAKRLLEFSHQQYGVVLILLIWSLSITPMVLVDETEEQCTTLYYHEKLQYEGYQS